ncbi:hypothetical protein [Pseudomonas viridiflava]|uniref:hypothetical protein n=1 Tax=Pseudomonas viridiflava TaxID=33069 RepID=UPI000F035C3D|nr:hypothetical protein [Pseudomonas viridiflava]
MSDVFFQLFFEIPLRYICYPIGWPVVRIVTWGKYPKKGSWLKDNWQAGWTSATGFVILVFSIVALFVH